MKEEFEKYRKEKGLTQIDMAESIGFKVLTYYRWINGKVKPSNTTMRKLRKFYNENIKRKELKMIADSPTELMVVSTPSHQSNKRKIERVQLCNADELIQELKDGNTVHVTDSEYKLKLVDGFIVRYKGDNAISINAPILTCERYHVYKIIPLQLKVGGRYKTDDGRIATIYMERDGTFAGIFDGTGTSETYDHSGNAELDENNNLIEEI